MGPRFCKRGNAAMAHTTAHTTTASMGPRFCKRGNPDSAAWGQPPHHPLQWGHAFVSVETPAPPRPARRTHRFNGATLL